MSSEPTDSPEIAHFLGLDLGQKQDPTALVVLERRLITDPDQPKKPAVAHYDLVAAKRFPLGTPYPAIVQEVATRVKRPPFQWPTLAVDQTGVGRAVVDMFREADLEAYLRPVLITSGHAVTTGDDGSAHVAKKELVSVLQVLFQARRLKIANVPERETLVRELAAFKVKITAAANETFESWRERDHDDLVLAVAIAAWMAESQPPFIAVETRSFDDETESITSRGRRFLGQH